MNRRFALLLAALATGLAVLVLALLLTPPRPTPAPVAAPSQPPAAVVAAAPEPPPPPPPPPAAPQPLATPQAPAPGAFAFRRLDIDTSRETSEACLVFTEKLAEDARYEDFVRVAPEQKPALRVAGDRLCLAGLPFGRSYELQLLAGLPAASGARLAEAEKVPVQWRDREALVAFRDGLILPRESAGGVPITTVNVEKLKLRLFRVPDRLVSRIRREEFAERTMYPYSLRVLERDRAALVWSGEILVRGARNETTSTLFAIGRALPERKPGLYLLAAENAATAVVRRATGSGDASDEEDYDYDGSYRPVAVQWLVETDIALTTMKGADGLHVFVRSLNTAKPLDGVELALVSRNNEELARARTDGDGHFLFAPGLLRGVGAASAAMVMAYGAAGDFAFQDLTRPAFDLSDRGVDGRDAPAPVDAFLYTERGIYRPGETVHVTALVRDRVADAMESTAAILIVQRPDGAEFRRVPLAAATSGALYHPLPLSDTAPRGRWQALLHLDPGAPPVGKVEFEVQDFVPQRLKVTVTPPASALERGGDVEIDAVARFLYGAPAAGLDGEAEAKIEVDPRPFPQHTGYRFGLVTDRFQEQVIKLELATTDDAGRTTVTGKLNEVPETTLPLRADIRVAVFEPGGRSTDEHVTAKLRTKPVFVGVRPLFKGERIREDTEAAFEVIAVDASGTLVQRRLDAELVEERSYYRWFSGDRGWRFDRFTEDKFKESATVEAKADGPSVFRRTLGWGYYRLTLHDKETGAATSVRFSAGWRGVLSEDRPDKVEVSSDKDAYSPGDTARIAVRPPSAGEALLVVAGDRVFERRVVNVPAEGTTIEIPVSAEWGSGAYAVVTTFRPLSQQASRAPVRAIGVAWMPLDAAPRTLGVAIGAPDKVKPSQRLAVPVTVTGAGERAVVTLAAVDEGILQLTRYKTPDPVAHYFGKRRLGIDIRDDYGRLIDARPMQLASREGGDALGGKGLDVVPTRTVALFSGVVTLDKDGRAEIPLEIPDFVGELRLMAVAADRTKVGAGESRLTVRDVVVADAVLPRFLAPGDTSRLSVNLHNVEGKAGDYRLRLTATGAVSLSDGTRTEALAEGERRLLAFRIDGASVGIATFALDVEGPDGLRLQRSWQMAVRPSQPVVTRQIVRELAPGAEQRVEPGDARGFIAGTARATVALASYRIFDVAPLLQSLDRYPYGCLEQTTSRAFPLLFVNDLSLLGGGRDDRALATRIQDAIWRILDMQTASGEFGMWRSGGDLAYSWLGIYAVDFLSQAKAKGFIVPDEALRRAQGFLQRVLASNGSTPGEGNTRAYAAYLLTRMTLANPADLRQLHDRGLKGTAIGEAHLAAALVMAGDRSRAQVSFTTAANSVDSGRYAANDYYGSPVRDLAVLTTVAAETGQSQLLPGLVDRLGRVNPRIELLSTQEKGWLVLAANALTRNRGRVAIEVDGTIFDQPGDPVRLTPQLDRATVIRNAGDRPLWETLTIAGVPAQPMPPTSEGVTIQRKFLTLSGEEADPATLRQNDRLIVLLTGRMQEWGHHEMALTDMLPAGWEIEGVVTRNDEDRSSYSFLPKTKRTKAREARDDRYVAAFDLARYGGRYQRYWFSSDDGEESLDFALAYIVRAVTPGTYTLPPATIEEMYRPAVVARTSTSTVTVLPR